MNSRIIRLGILACAVALVAAPAQAAFGFAKPANARPSAGSQDPYQYEIDRLIQMQDVRGNTIKSMKTMLQQFVDQGALTTRQLNAIAEEIADITYPKMKMALDRILRQNLSVEELRQINAFYETPAGKKLHSLQPALVEAGAQVVQQSDVQAQIQQVVQKHLGGK